MNPGGVERVFRSDLPVVQALAHHRLVRVSVLVCPLLEAAEEAQPTRWQGGLQVGATQPLARGEAQYLIGVVEVGVVRSSAAGALAATA